MTGHLAGFFALIPFPVLDADSRPPSQVDRLAGPGSDDGGAGAARARRSNARVVNVCWRYWIPLFSVHLPARELLESAAPHAAVSRSARPTRPHVSGALALAACSTPRVAGWLGPAGAAARCRASRCWSPSSSKTCCIISQHTHIPMALSHGRDVPPIRAIDAGGVHPLAAAAGAGCRWLAAALRRARAAPHVSVRARLSPRRVAVYAGTTRWAGGDGCRRPGRCPARSCSSRTATNRGSTYDAQPRSGGVRGVPAVCAFVLAGAVRPCGWRSPLSRALRRPLDCGTARSAAAALLRRKQDGARVRRDGAGDGVAFVAAVGTWLTAARPRLWPLTPLGYAALGAWSPDSGFMAGELPNSFVKRQLGIRAGLGRARDASRPPSRSSSIASIRVLGDARGPGAGRAGSAAGRWLSSSRRPARCTGLQRADVSARRQGEGRMTPLVLRARETLSSRAVGRGGKARALRADRARVPVPTASC